MTSQNNSIYDLNDYLNDENRTPNNDTKCTTENPQFSKEIQNKCNTEYHNKNPSAHSDHLPKSYESSTLTQTNVTDLQPSREENKLHITIDQKTNSRAGNNSGDSSESEDALKYHTDTMRGPREQKNASHHPEQPNNQGNDSPHDYRITESEPINTEHIQDNKNNQIPHLKINSVRIVAPINTDPSHVIIRIQPQQALSASPTLSSQSSSEVRRSGFSSLIANVRAIEDFECKIALLRALGYTIMMGILSLFAFLQPNYQITYQQSMIIIYSYLGFFIIENIARIFCRQRVAWFTREDKLNIVDAVSGIVFITCITYPAMISLIFATISAGFLPFIYGLLSEAPKAPKVIGVIIRALYALQVPLLMAQLTGVVNSDWRIAMAQTWALSLGIYIPILYIVAHRGFSKMVYLLKYLIFREFYHPSHLDLCIFYLWSGCYHILNPIFVVYLFGICQNLQQSDNFNLPKICSILGFILSLSLLASAYSVREILLENADMLNVCLVFLPPPEDAEIEEGNGTSLKKGIKTNFETVKHSQYFIKSSSCYFIPLSADSLTRASESIKERQDPISSTASLDNKPISLRIKRSFTQLISLSPIAKQAAQIRFDDKESPKCHSATLKKTNSLPFRISNSKKGDGKQDEPRDEDMCYVCYSGPKNAVFLNCGHGGICYECAIAHSKRQLQCMECRATIEAIACIQEETGLQGVFRCNKLTKIM